MAIKTQEQELLKGGARLIAPSDGPYVQNMLIKDNSWEVRKGFGQVAQLDTTFSALQYGATTREWGYMKHLGSHLLETRFGHKQIVSLFIADVETTSGLGEEDAFSRTGYTLQTVGAAGAAGTFRRRNAFLSIYVVSIYDLTTDAKFEEAIYKRTSEISLEQSMGNLDMTRWHGHYETNNTEDHTKWVHATDDSVAHFTEVNGNLYFGNKGTGLLAYFPSTFHTVQKNSRLNSARRPRGMALETIAQKSWAPPYSESPIVTRAVASENLPFANTATYFTQAEFPRAVCSARLGNRLVLADSSNTVYFSDDDAPASIVAENFIVVPSTEKIVAMAAQGQNLLIWTESTTWYYQPSAGFIASAGNLQVLSKSIGCATPNSVAEGTGYGTIYWVDGNGCYRSAGNGQIEVLSETIAPFFTDKVTNPLTNYYQGATAAGVVSGQIADAADAQPRTTLSFNPKGVTTSYWARHDLVLFSIPEMATILGFHQRTKQWTFWSTQSIAVDNATAVKATENIQNPWVVSDEKELYLVGGIETQTAANRSKNTLLAAVGSIDEDRSAISRSYYILQYGRGGGVDRSVEKGEDRRALLGKWYEAGPVSGSSASTILLGRPIPIPEDTAIGDPSSSVNAPAGSIWIPVYLVMDTVLAAATSDNFEIAFSFDNTHWTPLFRTTSSTELAWLAPPSRVGSQNGWGYGAAIHDTGSYIEGRKVSCYSSTSSPTAGTLSRTGHVIAMSFDPGGSGNKVGGGTYSALGVGAWPYYPSINNNVGEKTLLMYLPFAPKDATTDYQTGMGINIELAQYREPTTTGTFVPMRTAFWEESYLGALEHKDNDVSQAVDWLYKTDAVAAKQGMRVHARGLYSQLVSHGKAKSTNRLFPDFFWSGLYNVLLAADYRGWSSQVIDHTRYSDTAINTLEAGAADAITHASKDTAIRKRYKEITAGMIEDVVSSNPSSATVAPKYGTAGPGAGSNAPTTDFYIIDDEEVNTIAVSDSVKGDNFTYMVFGFIMDKAEKVAIESMRAAFRVLKAGRRRYGR